MFRWQKVTNGYPFSFVSSSRSPLCMISGITLKNILRIVCCGTCFSGSANAALRIYMINVLRTFLFRQISLSVWRKSSLQVKNAL